MLIRVIQGCMTLVLLVFSGVVLAKTPWGADYFPNTLLTTHDGESVYFFDDLIKDKIVAINFIYTSCPDSCPLETAQLARVQKIMGERVGKDVHFYSISIDPETDTPEVLKKYRDRFGAKWTFLTGNKQEIIQLRRKLGLYIEGVENGRNQNNHNVSMIIGNQATGRWMKRSPFENPYVLADQLGNWLSGWKSPQKGKDYATAPKLRPISQGESIFRTRCASCHSIDGIEEEGDLGPDLMGVTQRRELDWLVRWLLAPDKMIANKDPLALELLKKYNDLIMPNFRLNRQEVMDLIDYMNTLGEDLEFASVTEDEQKSESPEIDVVAVMNAWVREAHPQAEVNAGYMTLVNVGGDDVVLQAAYSADFESVEFHEMLMVEGMMEMRELKEQRVASGGQLKFITGGKHLMLKNPKRNLADGDTVEVVLMFQSGIKQSVSLKVKK